MKFNRADKEKIKELALKHGVPVSVIEEVVSSPYEFIRSQSKEIDFKDGMNREEFDSMKTNFNIPSIGKLYASHFLYNNIQNNKEKSKKNK